MLSVFSFFRFLLIVGLMLTPLTSFSHSGATGVVKQRMDMMKQFKKEIKVIRKMVRGDLPVNRQTVLQTGGNIEESAKQLADLFPPESNPHPSEADDLIWQEWDQFVDSVRLMSEQARLLQQAAETGETDSIATAYKKLNSSCKQCHELYRQ